MFTGMHQKLILAFLWVALASPALAEGVLLEDAFSPHQGATQLVVSTIQNAKHSIRVAAYSFTSKAIGWAAKSKATLTCQLRPPFFVTL